jgi:hypothetical protein
LLSLAVLEPAVHRPAAAAAVAALPRPLQHWTPVLAAARGLKLAPLLVMCCLSLLLLQCCQALLHLRSVVPLKD